MKWKYKKNVKINKKKTIHIWMEIFEIKNMLMIETLYHLFPEEVPIRPPSTVSNNRYVKIKGKYAQM